MQYALPFLLMSHDLPMQKERKKKEVRWAENADNFSFGYDQKHTRLESAKGNESGW